MTKDQALKMAIEALLTGNQYADAINACKEALEKPTQEPVAWMHCVDEDITEFNDFQACPKCEPLYTHPAPSWQGLSDDEIIAISNTCDLNHVLGLIDFGRAIEQALKEKNHGS